jgi:hypothetical protein
MKQGQYTTRQIVFSLEQHKIALIRRRIMGVCSEKTCKQARQKRRLTTQAGKENKQNEMKEKQQ